MREEEKEKMVSRVRSSIPGGLNPRDEEVVRDVISRYHTHDVPAEHCSSMVAQRVNARVELVWSVVSRFDKPQTYKHFVRSCNTVQGDGGVGSVREVSLVSGLPATTSTERLELLDPAHHAISFRILGGEHRLRDYHSVTTLNQFVDAVSSNAWTLVLESYVVGIPDGNTKEDTCMFADTVVRCNLQSLAQVSEHLQQNQERQGVLPALIAHSHPNSSSG
ncbi:hypothetical protein SUGI_0059990 [Cryptomeria japonica]|uniref:abscisic acid receptor PYL2 n=1 Tax=Cryptomeria japonica TaxID=3369 RepID=UPI002408B6AF|nr:abscisic acid receptor PYL2 [Cryptomeria japonica]GLJ07155.1 hypothetical protein SUGI_0059990 [Cryptomeria japonica]